MRQMQEQSKAQLFLSEQRICNETEWFRSYDSFNFNQLQNCCPVDFAGLYAIKDHTLAAGRTLSQKIPEDTLLLLLPVVGAVWYNDNRGSNGLVDAGKIQLLHLAKSGTVEITNPYEHELVNFIELWVKIPRSINQVDGCLHFNLDAHKDQLLSLCNSNSVYPILSVGKFGGRKEACYQPAEKTNHVFVLVIEGVFEVQGRLLQYRDVLALWDNPNQIELEALSNDAIILFVELPA